MDRRLGLTVAPRGIWLARSVMPGPRPAWRQRPARGFTLIELMLVIALIAIGAGVATLALRDSNAGQLENEAARLSALLEAARAEARASGLSVRWEPRSADAGGVDFRFIGMPKTEVLPDRWLAPGVTAQVIGARAVVLGPDALIPPQQIVLSLADRRITLATDGLGPFAVPPTP